MEGNFLLKFSLLKDRFDLMAYNFFCRQIATEKIGIKESRVLKSLGKVKTVIFDQECVSKNNLKVEKVVALNGYQEEEVLTLIGGISFLSENPFAKAATSLIKEKGIKIKKPPLKVVEFSGKGITGHFGTRSLYFGQASFLKEQEVKLGKDEGVWEEAERKGYKVALLATGGKLAGYLLLTKELKLEIKEIIQELEKRGIKRTIFLADDKEEVALQKAAKLGFKEVCLYSSGQDKSKCLREILLLTEFTLWVKGPENVEIENLPDSIVTAGEGEFDIQLPTESFFKLPSLFDLLPLVQQKALRSLQFLLAGSILGIVLTAGLIWGILY